MKIIKIFLASSEELKPERLVIAELITKLNYLWAEYDISIRLVKWEYLDSSMGAQHKQEDYNDYLRQCDMCVVLYWTKFGMYTEIELETAYKIFTSGGNLKQMAVMFKDGGDMTPQQVIQCIQLKIEDEHELLTKNIRKLQKLLTITEEDDSDYKEYLYEFQSAKNELAKNESLISDLGRTIQNI